MQEGTAVAANTPSTTFPVDGSIVGNLTAGQWLRIIKLFELELSTRKIAAQLLMPFNTAYRAIHTIRTAILVHSQGTNLFLGVKLRSTSLISVDAGKENGDGVQVERFRSSGFWSETARFWWKLCPMSKRRRS